MTLSRPVECWNRGSLKTFRLLGNTWKNTAIKLHATPRELRVWRKLWNVSFKTFIILKLRCFYCFSVCDIFPKQSQMIKGPSQKMKLLNRIKAAQWWGKVETRMMMKKIPVYPLRKWSCLSLTWCEPLSYLILVCPRCSWRELSLGQSGARKFHLCQKWASHNPRLTCLHRPPYP